MAFDFLGTMTRGQWESLKKWVEAAAKNRNSMEDSLNTEISKQEGFAAKVLFAEAFSGGTSVSGFDGGIYKSTDREDPRSGEYRQRENSGDPPLDQLLQFLLARAPDRETFISIDGVEVLANDGNFGGGDLPWLDIPQAPQIANPGGANDDRRTFPLVDFLKLNISGQIEFTRGWMELQCKSALDRREQLLILLYELGQAGELNNRVIAQVKNQFKFANPGTEVDDPKADVIIQRSGSPKLVSASDTEYQDMRLTNLWENYPATRMFPTWPLLLPQERGNLGEFFQEDPQVGGPVNGERFTDR